jgi:hypothetical protein
MYKNLETFNRDFFDNHLLAWYGNCGVIKINDEVNAEIRLNESGVKGVYDNYNVKIISKKNGVITVQNFYFDNYFKKRIDARQEKKVGFHIWHNNGVFRWYIAIPDPEEIHIMSISIMEYISLWR